MFINVYLSLFIVVKIVQSNDECRLINTNDFISDCNCRISTLNDLNNQRLRPLLRQIVQKNYFRFFPMNLRKKCQFWSDQGQCSLRNCAIKSCSQEDLPSALRDCSTELDSTNSSLLSSLNKNLTEEQKQTIETWKEFDDSQADNFCDVDDEKSIDFEYIDLTINLERFTGYTGPSTQRVWSAIYNENCFFLPDSKIYYNLRQKRLNSDQMCLEGRTFYRLISGLHTSISIHLCAEYFFPTPGGGFLGIDGQWKANFDEFHQRFEPSTTDGEGPKWLKNVYFIYLIELKAIHKARDVLSDQTFFTGNETDDLETKHLIVERLLKEIEPYGNYFNENQFFQNEHAQLKREFRERFRNISHIMDCVGCDKCKLWGKLQIQGLGTALKILFATNPIQLQRSEIVALINAFTRLSTSLYQLEHTFKTCIAKDNEEL